MGELKPGWKRVKLGEIIERHVEHVANVTTYSRFVGVDDLDTGDLRLRRHGTVGVDEIPPTFRYVFRAGMILLPTRRPRLRKCALAPFDGLTGEKILVLKPKAGSGLHPMFAPHLLSSPHVQNWNIESEVGSVTPHFRWGDMAECEVVLPPVEEQQRMTMALAAARASAESTSEALAAHRELGRALIEDVILEDLPTARTIQDLIDHGILESPQDGNHGEKHPKANDFVEIGIPFLMASDVRDDRVNLTACKFITKRLGDSLRIGFAKEGDVLLTHKGTVGESAILPALAWDYVMLSPQVTYYRSVPERLLPTYLRSVFRSTFFQQQLRAHERQSTRSYVGVTTQRRLQITCPSPSRQRQVVEVVEAFDFGGRSLEARARSAATVLQVLRERLLNRNH